jgi:hypothetical protein
MRRNRIRRGHERDEELDELCGRNGESLKHPRDARPAHSHHRLEIAASSRAGSALKMGSFLAFLFLSRGKINSAFNYPR